MKKIPLHSLVLLIGPGKAGKTTLASAFSSYEVLNYSEVNASLIGYDNKQDINSITQAEIVHRMKIKLSLGERVVVDGSHLRKQDRSVLTSVASQMGIGIFYIVVNRSNDEKIKTSPNHVDMIEISEKRFLENEKEILRGDGVATVIDTRKETFEIVKKLNLQAASKDILSHGFKGVMALGDVHGMKESLKSAIDWANARNLFMLFLGDIIDYGPHSLDCVDIVHDLLIRGKAAMIIGNHEKKIERWLLQYREFKNSGAPIKIKLSDGNKMTTDKIESMTPLAKVKFETKFAGMLNLSANHIVIDSFLFTHGAAEPEMFDYKMNRLQKRLESMALYGEVDNERKFNEDGYPNRVYNWVNRIPEGKKVVVGHDIRSYGKPLTEVGSLGGEATFLDTGSGKGGHLTTAHIIRTENGNWQIESFTAH